MCTCRQRVFTIGSFLSTPFSSWTNMKHKIEDWKAVKNDKKCTSPPRAPVETASGEQEERPIVHIKSVKGKKRNRGNKSDSKKRRNKRICRRSRLSQCIESPKVCLDDEFNEIIILAQYSALGSSPKYVDQAGKSSSRLLSPCTTPSTCFNQLTQTSEQSLHHNTQAVFIKEEPLDEDFMKEEPLDTDFMKEEPMDIDFIKKERVDEDFIQQMPADEVVRSSPTVLKQEPSEEHVSLFGATDTSIDESGNGLDLDVLIEEIFIQNADNTPATIMPSEENILPSVECSNTSQYEVDPFLDKMQENDEMNGPTTEVEEDSDLFASSQNMQDECNHVFPNIVQSPAAYIQDNVKPETVIDSETASCGQVVRAVEDSPLGAQMVRSGVTVQSSQKVTPTPSADFSVHTAQLNAEEEISIKLCSEVSQHTSNPVSNTREVENKKALHESSADSAVLQVKDADTKAGKQLSSPVSLESKALSVEELSEDLSLSDSQFLGLDDRCDLTEQELSDNPTNTSFYVTPVLEVESKNVQQKSSPVLGVKDVENQDDGGISCPISPLPLVINTCSEEDFSEDLTLTDSQFLKLTEKCGNEPVSSNNLVGPSTESAEKGQIDMEKAPSEQPPPRPSSVSFAVSTVPSMDWIHKTAESCQRLRMVTQDISRLNALVLRARRRLWPRQQSVQVSLQQQVEPTVNLMSHPQPPEDHQCRLQPGGTSKTLLDPEWNFS